MYFGKSRVRKIWLDKCLKSLFQRTLRQTTWQIGRNFVAIIMTEPFQYLFNTFKVGTLEKAFFSDTQNPKTVC